MTGSAATATRHRWTTEDVEPRLALIDCEGPTRSLVLRFPNDWLSAWLPLPETELSLPVGTVADQLAGLVALAAGPTAQTLRPSDQLYRRLHDALRERCLESDLSPHELAASRRFRRAHGVGPLEFRKRRAQHLHNRNPLLS